MDSKKGLSKFVNYEQDTPWLKETNTLRILVGVLGVLLPLLLWLFLLLDSGRISPLPSISHYYFTRANSVFIIVVSLLAIFLLIYRYMGAADFILSSLAGLGALSLLIFPTYNLCSPDCNLHCDCEEHITTVVAANSGRELFHYAAAGVFLFCLAMMSLFLFTKTNKDIPPTPRKILRNRIYRLCAVMMIAAMLVIFPGSKIIPEEIYDGNNLTFWMETIAVEFFGISWLVKAEVVLKG